MNCKGTMQIRFIKDHPTERGWSNSRGNGKYNIGATLKGINLVLQGYAVLIHSCKECNSYHLNINEDYYK